MEVKQTAYPLAPFQRKGECALNNVLLIIISLFFRNRQLTNMNYTLTKQKCLSKAFLPLWGRLGWGFLLFLFSSCVEKTDWPTQAVTDNRIVVEGIITNELKQHVVTLTYPTAELNAVPTPVSGAVVSLNDEDTTYLLIEESVGSGTYLSDSLQAVTNKTYTLSISFNGITYTAQTYLLPVTPIIPISYYFNNFDSLFYYDWQHDIYFSENAMYELFFDWSKVAGYDTLDVSQTQFMGYTYTLTGIDVNEIFAAQKEKVAFPAGTIITERKYSLTAEHADYIRALLSETQWNGNVFEAMPANLPTNLSNGAIGYFGGCSVLTDTIVVN